uniref:Large ribosomal subunit protein bL33m n=1 Tax=Blastobotrys adeninivorans TaxID=409370 RepID=A0A060T2I7_BLAAD
MAKDKSRLTLIKLVSSAKTGYMRYIFRPRSSPVVTQVRYDPIVKRHVLFTEARKRKVADVKPPIFQ